MIKRLVFPIKDVFSSKNVSGKEVHRLLKKGFSIYRLTMPYGTALAGYEFAISDGQTVFQITSRAMGEFKEVDVV